MSQHKAITFDQVVRGIIAIVAVLIFIWLINYLRHVLLPFCVACLIAYVLEPVVQWQQKHMKLKRRIIPVFLTLAEAFVVVAGLAWVIIPMTFDEIETIDKLIKSTSGHSTPLLPPEVQEFFKQNLNIENLRRFLDPQRLLEVFSKGTSVLSSTLEFLMHTIEWLLTFIYVVFIMLDYHRLMSGFRKVIPPRYRASVYPVLDDIKVNMDRYFRSQAVIAACAAVLYCVGFYIAGMPLAIVMGLIVGVLYMIPYVQYVTIIPVIVLCYLDSLTGAGSFWSEFGKCLLVYVVSQCICDYLLTPKIMGKTLGMDPAIILLSLSVWGSLMGVIGMIVALPLTALMIAYYKQYILSTPQKVNKE